MTFYSCFDVDGSDRVYESMEIICYEGPHVYWSLGVALPSIVVWGMGIPLFALVLMIQNKKKLKTIQMKEKLGFLYNGYKLKYYFWEVIIMYRKIMMVVISVVIYQFGVITQALIVFLLLILFSLLHTLHQPYSFQTLNHLEAISLFSQMITVYCGVFYISDMPQVYNSKDPNVRQADNGCKHTVN